MENILDTKHIIKETIGRKGILTLKEIRQMFPKHDISYIDKVIHDLIMEGEFLQKTDRKTGCTNYFKRFYTKEGSFIIFHYLDSPEPEKFDKIILKEEMPWFFEPIDKNSNKSIFSANYKDPISALKVAEELENEEL